MIIDQPCVSCGITLEKGVKTVAVVDIIKGSLGIIISSVFLVYFLADPHVIVRKEQTSSGLDENKIVTEAKEKIEWYYDEFCITITFLVVSIIEVFLAVLLYYSTTKKSVPFLHFWLIVTGFLTPVNIFLIKIYEMIVVFAYTEDLTCEAGGKALEEFRKLPYTCNIKTQLYPTPVYGPINSSNLNADEIPTNGNIIETERRPSIYLTDKSILMNVDSAVFSKIQHHNL